MSFNSEHFELVVNSLENPLFLSNGKGEILYINNALRDFLELPKNRYSQNIVSIDLSDSPLEGEFTKKLKKEDGTSLLVKLVVKVISPDLRMYRVISSISQENPFPLFHSQRLEALGLLSGGIAHDFNNILMGILGHVTYLKSILPNEGIHTESLNAIEDGTKRGSSITKQILNFSRIDGQVKASPLDIGETVSRTCNLIRRLVPLPHHFEYSECCRSLKVFAQEAQLAQIVVNLVVNAKDALSEKGAISVSVREVHDKNELREVFYGMDSVSKNYVKICVSDTGHGIPKELQAKIFEPYFSTKQEKGTGLGLATVQTIVKALGGAIWIDSTVGKGTLISVYFPLFQEEDVLKPAPIELSSHRKERVQKKVIHILVVDDEYPIRNVLSMSLSHLGYKVTAASSGNEALKIFEKSDPPVDLIISDILMPQMTGDELFFELKKRDPKVKMMLMSGFASDEIIRAVLEEGASGFISKPFTITDLAQKVKEAL